ncbi:MAG: (2Fe-2S)-binding protein [Asticcacaulis sp.]
MISLKINGKPHTLDLPEDMPVLWVLRDELGLTGTKFGCGIAQCGACTVHIDGVPVRSCVTPLSVAEGTEITTLEGVSETAAGQALLKVWAEDDVMQCGYCQSGQIMAATALLMENPAPTDADIDMAMDGNICRCATYTRIRAGIKRAAGLSPADTREA